MRNLRKYFAVFVAVALLVTAIAPAFAADTADTATTTPAAAPAMADSKVCETLGMLVGDGSGVTDAYLATAPTKIQSAIMFLRLKGLEKDAKAYKGTDNFKDADKVDWAEGKAILGYLKSKPELGFIGDGTNFDPNTAITAQQYYKILLVALGYAEDTGKGGDFKYDDTIKFAESKGLKAVAAVKSFTIKDIATATVEALKAAVKGGTKTLVASLVDSKVIDAAKAQTTGLVSGTASAFELTNTAKDLKVTFNAAPADAKNVTFTVTRDAGIAVEATFTQDAKDKAVFKYTASSNLVAGEYKVAVKNDKADLGSKTIKVEAEKLTKIELTSKLINRTSDTKGIANYKAYNQYNEDVTKLPIAGNITWSSSLDSGTGKAIEGSKGLLTITKGTDTDTAYLSKLKDFTTTPIVITAYDKDSNIVVSENMTVSATLGDIQSLKLIGVSNKDKKTVIEKETTDVFYIDYEAKDSNGNLVTSYDVFSNTNAFILSPTTNQSTIAWATVERDPNDDKKAVFKISVAPTPNNIAGSQVISAIAASSGKSASITVDVKEGSALAEFILQKPTQDVAIGDGFVEVPYIAVDSNGAQITDFAKINKAITAGKLTFNGMDAIDHVQNPDGTYKLYMKFGDTETSKTITANCQTTTTTKMSQMTLNVKKRAVPTTLTSVNIDTFMVAGASHQKAMDMFKINDQYDRALNLRHDSNIFEEVNSSGQTEKWEYFVTAWSDDTSKFTVNFSEPGGYFSAAGQTGDLSTTGLQSVKSAVYGHARKFKAIATDDPTLNGSATITFSLLKRKVSGGTVTTDGTIKEVSTKPVTFTKVDLKDITSYVVDTIPKLYAADTGDKYSFSNTDAAYKEVRPTTTNGVANNDGKYVDGVQSTTAYTTISPATGNEAKNKDDILIKGVLSGGQKVRIPDNMILSKEVSDTTKFGKDDKKVYAKPLDSNSAATATGKYNVSVKGYNGVVYQAQADLNSSNEKPVAASIEVSLADSPVTDVVTTYGAAKKTYNKSWAPRWAKIDGDTVKIPRNVFVTQMIVNDATVGDPDTGVLYDMKYSGGFRHMTKFATVDMTNVTVGAFTYASADTWSAALSTTTYSDPAKSAADRATTPAYFKAGSDFNKAAVSFTIKDQYNREALIPDYINIVKQTNAAGTDITTYTMANGILSLSSNTAVINVGDVIYVTCTKDSLSKTVRLVLTADDTDPWDNH